MRHSFISFYVFLIFIILSITSYANIYNADNNISVRIGIFNSQKNAQDFFERLPYQLQNSIKHEQLWLNAYEDTTGLTAHHLEISQLDKLSANQVCDAAKEFNMQCIPTTRSPWKANAAPEKTLKITVPESQQYVSKPNYVYDEQTLEKSDDDTDSNKFLVNKNIDKQRQVSTEEFNESRTKFLDLLKTVGEGLNNGHGNTVVIEYLVSLGKDTFLKAGKASIFNSLNNKELDTLSQNPEIEKNIFNSFTEEFSEHGQEMTQNLIMNIYSKIEAGEPLNANTFKDGTETFITSAAQNIVDNKLRKIRNSHLQLLRNLEVEYKLNNFENAYLSLLTTQPIYQSKDARHNVFLQGGGIINEQSIDINDNLSRHTINLGAAYRYLTKDEKYLLGANTFFDHQWPYNHSRMSLGVDAKAQNLNLAANYYIPMSDYKDSRTDSSGNTYEERALQGYDIEFGYQFPQLPALKTYIKSYQYFTDLEGKEDIRGLELSGEFNVGKHLTLKGAVVEENGGKDGIELSFKYSMPLYDQNAFNLALEDAKNSINKQSMKSRVFEKVRRENSLRLEERRKEDTISITSEFNSLSIGLPFDVGGTLTAAATELPIDTSITIPSGDYGIINFSNGAIANLSASGAGNIIVSFNSTTLFVEQTGGGFVQFISAGGSINTVHVPGGVVNLLGTDIDITDNGITTTIQVRSGDINVVPNIGVSELAGTQTDVVNLTVATGATSLLINPALETRQEAAFTNLDLTNPVSSGTNKSAPAVNSLPALITGPQFVGNNADIRLTLNQPVTVSGAPFINALVGINARTFAYNAAASTPSQLVFRHVFIAGDLGAGSITIQSLDLNGGSIQGTTNNLNAITAFTDTIVAITDQTAPSLTASTPVDEEPLFGSGSNIILTFDENVQANVGNITITDITDGSSTQLIPIGDAQITIVGNTVTINPTAILDLTTNYDLTIPTGVIEDATGNAFEGIASGELNFTTSNDMTAPLLTSNSPTDNATGTARNSTIVLTFDEDVALAGTINLVDTDDGTGTIAYTVASPEVSIVNNVITITPASSLEYAENYEVTWALGAIQDLVTNNAIASTSGNINFKTIDLEAALALTLSITGVDGNIDETNVQASGTPFTRNSDAVFAADITVPVSPNGVIFEGGGTGIGAWVGFNTGDGVFRARAGDGVALPDTDAASAEIAIGSIAPGDYTLTWEFDVALGRVRVWLDENLIATDTAVAGNFETNTWAGTDNYGYGAITAGNNSLTIGEITTSYTGTLNSNLRYYNAQTLP